MAGIFPVSYRLQLYLSNGSFSFWVPLGARQPMMSRRMDYPDATLADLSYIFFHHTWIPPYLKLLHTIVVPGHSTSNHYSLILCIGLTPGKALRSLYQILDAKES